MVLLCHTQFLKLTPELSELGVLEHDFAVSESSNWEAPQISVRQTVWCLTAKTALARRIPVALTWPRSQRNKEEWTWATEALKKTLHIKQDQKGQTKSTARGSHFSFRVLEELKHKPLKNWHVLSSEIPHYQRNRQYFDSSFYILLLEEDKKLPTSASQRRKEKVSRTRKF